METNLVVLKRFLEAFGQSSAIGTVAERKAIQKAVYLGQVLAQVDLGYRFGWYIMGPYSAHLAKDYYALASTEALGDLSGSEKDLNPSVKANLALAKRAIEMPSGCDLPHDAWLELLASWHYLRNVSRYDQTLAETTMRAQKPHLVSYLDYAKKLLEPLSGT
jgi:uncharacterized protein YwgA